MNASHYIKTTIIGRSIIIALIGFYASLFIFQERWGSAVWLLAVFCILPYGIIYFHRVRKYGIALLIMISVGIGYYIGRNLYLILGFAAVIIGFYQTANAIHEDVHNKIKVSSFGVFTGESVEKFVTYFTMAYVFCFVAFNQTFTLTCDELYRYSNQAMDVVLFRDERVKTYVSSFFQSIPLTTISHSGTSITNNTNQTGSMIRNDLLKRGGILRNSLLYQTVDQANALEEGVCGLLLNQIKVRYDNPNFKLSVIFSLYLLMRPALEIILHLISYLNRLLFSGMFKLGWFRKYEDREISENIE